MADMTVEWMDLGIGEPGDLQTLDPIELLYIYIYILFFSPVGFKGSRFHYWKYFIFFQGS